MTQDRATGEKVVGYRRVSSAGQNLARQELPEVTGRIFEEKLTGARRDRPALQEMIAYIRDGDEVHVHSIDRLARSLRDLQGIVDDIIGKGASIRFLKEGLHFMPNVKADPFQKLMFQMLGSFAEFEKSLIEARRDEGIAKAKAEGKYKGRQRSIDQHVVYDLHTIHKCTGDQIAKWMGIGRASVFRILKQAKENADDRTFWVALHVQRDLALQLITAAERGLKDQALIDEVIEHDRRALIIPEWIEHMVNSYAVGEIREQYDYFKAAADQVDELFHMNGPAAYTQSRLEWLIKNDKPHEVMAERLALPIEAIPAVIEAMEAIPALAQASLEQKDGK